MSDAKPASEPAGLYEKYVVKKANGVPTDPDAEYLVLRLDTDETCRVAALAWADALESDGRVVHAMGVRAKVASLRGGR